jgi:hypothetical protein
MLRSIEGTSLMVTSRDNTSSSGRGPLWGLPADFGDDGGVREGGAVAGVEVLHSGRGGGVEGGGMLLTTIWHLGTTWLLFFASRGTQCAADCFRNDTALSESTATRRR